MLSPVEMDAIVDLLEHGDNTPKNISRNTGRNRKNVSDRLQDLEDKGLAISKGGGVYALTREGILMAQAVRRNR